MKKAVFLDRDGVINNNQNQYYIWRPEDLVINPGVIRTLKKLKEAGYFLIVISNQGGVSRGHYSSEDVDRLHNTLQNRFESEGAAVDDFYYCPHHQEIEACLCRKPLPLMIEKAMARYGIDPGHSWFIGDSQRDVDAGKAAGLKTIHVESNGDLEGVISEIVDNG